MAFSFQAEPGQVKTSQLCQIYGYRANDGAPLCQMLRFVLHERMHEFKAHLVVGFARDRRQVYSPGDALRAAGNARLGNRGGEKVWIQVAVEDCGNAETGDLCSLRAGAHISGAVTHQHNGRSAARSRVVVAQPEMVAQRVRPVGAAGSQQVADFVCGSGERRSPVTAAVPFGKNSLQHSLGRNMIARTAYIGALHLNGTLKFSLVDARVAQGEARRFEAIQRHAVVDGRPEVGAVQRCVESIWNISACLAVPDPLPQVAPMCSAEITHITQNAGTQKRGIGPFALRG